MELLDCSVEFVKEWLKSQFAPGMSWDNMGKHWHIDHFVPVTSFNLEIKEEQNKCFHWSNMQPLTKEQNLEKGAKIPTSPEQERHKIKIKNFKQTMDRKSSLPSTKGNVDGKQLDTLEESAASDALQKLSL